MSAEQQVSRGHGVVVLAAYRPDPDLFTIQLQSIRDQTRKDFRCLIGADGGQEEVRSLVADIVGDDPRFEVLGWDDNLGFYLNFERLLMAVPNDASWVALSDQDDRWYPDKLERLVPLLADATLATGQGRVVRWLDGRVLLEQTSRRVVPAHDLVFENQVTGSFSVFRRSLLDTALPFPRMLTVTQLHDHWLALAAAATGGYTVLDQVVQDYVQHGQNLVGEVGTQRRWTALTIVHRWVELADHYAGGHTPSRMLATSRDLSFGWRRFMVRTILDRLSGLGALPPETLTISVAKRRYSLLALARATYSSNIATSVVATFFAGLPGELLKPYDPSRATEGMTRAQKRRRRR